MALHPLLRVRGLRKHFPAPRRLFQTQGPAVRAVEDVSFDVHHGEAFGIVGESGCGKSTLARAILRLVEPDAGVVLHRGRDVLSAQGPALLALRRKMQIVFQDPYSSLDPRQSVGSALAEPMRVHGLARTRRAARDRAVALLGEVGLPPDALDRLPHEFSGGQRQRIGLARALAVEPELIIADEPVSALDVGVRAQVLILLRDLRERRGLAFVFVSHDLSVVRWFCSRVAVMYLGRIAEEGPSARVLADPLHPYARLLRDASPEPDPSRRGALPRATGEPPSASAPPPGCAFHPRCPRAMPVCRERPPRWTPTPDGGGVACHLHG